MKTFHTKNSSKTKSFLGDQKKLVEGCGGSCDCSCTPCLTLKNQGTTVGTSTGISTMNFTGSGVTTTASGSVATINIPSAGTVTLSGDVTGLSSVNTVIALRGTPISATPPTPGQVLTDVGGVWVGQNLPTSSIGVAEFVRTIQSPNNSIPPATMFTIDTTVINTDPSAIVLSAGAGGSVFTLSAGLYSFDYEMSLTSASSVGVYVGPTAGSLALDTNSVSGSSTGTTWIHGRHHLNVSTTLVAGISSVVGTAAIATTGSDAGSYMIRLTIMKLS